MTLQLERKLFTRKDYHAMVDAGVLTEKDKVELLDGNIIKMSPIGSKHLAIVNRLTLFFSQSLPQDFILSIQNPIGLGDLSEPEPDVAILKYRKDFYENEKPTAKDVELVIEVADSTLAKDEELKVPLYAKAGIKEAWIVDLVNTEIKVFTMPSKDRYLKVQSYTLGSEINVSFIEGHSIQVSKVFGR